VGIKNPTLLLLLQVTANGQFPTDHIGNYPYFKSQLYFSNKHLTLLRFLLHTHK
jgi:hypothetical protein